MRSRVVRIEGGLVAGVVLLLLGLLWTFDNLGFLDAGAILRWWPALLVAWGLARIFGLGSCRRPVAGAVLVAIGSLLLVDELNALPYGIWDLWPVVLIVAGGAVIWGALHGGGRWRPGLGSGPADAGSELRGVAIMSGVERRVQSDAFRGGEAVAVMGGLEVDLRDAHVAEGEAVIDVLALMGGIELYVPPDWRVVCEAMPVMGAVEDKRKAPPAEAKNVLRVRGFVMMGGLEVKDLKDKD